jgi:2-iminobutanoate/2-iminopropanoate deaminase
MAEVRYSGVHKVQLKRQVATEFAPPPVGPYSQAVRAGDFVLVAGQLGIDPRTSRMVEGGIKEQTRQALDNLGAIAVAAGGSLADVVKTTVFLRDFSQFAAMNEIYAGYFTSIPPARSTVEVGRLPADGVVEIEAILWAARRDSN